MHQRSILTLLVISLIGLPALAQKAPLCPIDGNGRVADVFYSSQAVHFEPIVAHARLQLTVRTPCDTLIKIFKKGESPSFDLGQVVGAVDGAYTWELRVVPEVDPGVRKALNQARANGDFKTPIELQQKGLLPSGPLVESATFQVFRGEIVDPTTGEQEEGGKASLASSSLSPSRTNGSVAFANDGLSAEGAPLTRASAADFVINDDLIVDGSACIGFDCVNGEVFSFDTIRLKENNLRIKFDDTSLAANFPRNDWQIVANESANGGASKFSIEDVSAARTPFTIEANARSHSLYVDDGGRIGSRTSTPSVEIHTIDGDTPTLRLQQDGSSGFEPQTWDVAGNETNFFVRDVTNGSALPFRIRPGAPSSSIFVDVDGDVGIGTSSPANSLSVVRSDATAKILVDENNATIATRQLLELESNGNPQFRMEDTQAGGQAWAFTVGLSAFSISNFAVAGTQFQVDNNGDIRAQGNIFSGGTQLNVPDYVFEPDYSLMPITELKSFVAANKHLPNVPNAEAIQQGGLNHSEFQMRLLEKIEELTLYTLEQHDSLSTLRLENAELQKRLQALETSVGVTTAK